MEPSRSVPEMVFAMAVTEYAVSKFARLILGRLTIFGVSFTLFERGGLMNRLSIDR